MSSNWDMDKTLEYIKSSFDAQKEDELSLTSKKEQKSCEQDDINLLNLQEMEKKRIARELHDTTVQNLTSMVHKLELCTRLIDMDPIRAKLELQTMVLLIRNTIAEMRETIYNLRPMSLDDLGLVSTIENFIKQKEAEEDIKYHFYLKGEEEKIEAMVDLSIFRLIQEACNNARKHAEPKNITIQLIYEKNQICVVVKDDGRGFNWKKAREKQGSFGLSIMEERAHLLKGEISIDSTPGKGTVVKIQIPINHGLEEKK